MSARQPFGEECERNGWLAKDILCDVCGKRPWAAWWRGVKEWFVCRQCAAEALPAMYADATIEPGKTTPTHALAAARTFRRRFDRAWKLARRQMVEARLSEAAERAAIVAGTEHDSDGELDTALGPAPEVSPGCVTIKPALRRPYVRSPKKEESNNEVQ